MGQQEVYDFLMKNPDQWYTSKEISEKLMVSIGSVTMSLKKLRKTNIIKYRNTGKRNTFQYMVQSEPVKLVERKMPLLQEQISPTSQPETTKVKVKIKPKIVHQHTYLSGQTFYGVIRPKEEVEAIERQRQEEQSRIAARLAAKKTAARRKAAVRRVKRAPVRKTVKRAVSRKALRTRSASRGARTKSAKKAKR